MMNGELLEELYSDVTKPFVPYRTVPGSWDSTSFIMGNFQGCQTYRVTLSTAMCGDGLHSAPKIELSGSGCQHAAVSGLNHPKLLQSWIYANKRTI